MIKPSWFQHYQGRDFRIGMAMYTVPALLTILPWRLAYSLTHLLCQPRQVAISRYQR